MKLVERVEGGKGGKGGREVGGVQKPAAIELYTKRQFEQLLKYL